VTYKTGFGLDILHLIHSHNTELQALQRYRYSTHFAVNRCTRTRVLTVFNSRILATNLKQSHCRLKSHMKSSCHSLIYSCRFFSTTFFDCHLQNSTQFSTTTNSNSSSTELSQLLTTAALLELLVILPWDGPLGKYRLLLSRIVLGVFTDPLPGNRRSIIARIGSRGNVFTESLPSNGYPRHNIHSLSYKQDTV
jgi:hypothetical protein